MRVEDMERDMRLRDKKRIRQSLDLETKDIETHLQKMHSVLITKLCKLV